VVVFRMDAGPGHLWLTNDNFIWQRQQLAAMSDKYSARKFHEHLFLVLR
jgi:hypothetical protein